MYVLDNSSVDSHYRQEVGTELVITFFAVYIYKLTASSPF